MLRVLPAFNDSVTATTGAAVAATQSLLLHHTHMNLSPACCQPVIVITFELGSSSTANQESAVLQAELSALLQDDAE